MYCIITIISIQSFIHMYLKVNNDESYVFLYAKSTRQDTYLSFVSVDKSKM